jgi:hypothetical protein
MGSMGGGYPPSQFGGSSTGTGGFFWSYKSQQNIINSIIKIKNH